MSTELTKFAEPELINFQTQRFELEQRLANLFVKSGLFSDIKGQSIEQSIAQAYVKIAMGNSMGFSPAESMQGIDIIQGKPVVGSQLRAARMQRAGYSWSIDRLDNKGCELTVKNGAGVLGKAVFLEEDARAMGLLAKDNWKKDPSSMYFARAITRAQRRYAPGVLSLDIPTPDEAYDLQASDVITMPSQASVGAALATENKTEALKEKIKDKRSGGEAAKRGGLLEPGATDAPWGGVPQADAAPAATVGGVAQAPVSTAAPAPAPEDEPANKFPARYGSSTTASTQAAPALGQYPFGKPYAELEPWQKEILAVMGNLTQEQGMAALSTVGIMSLSEIWGEKITVALKALRDAVAGGPGKTKDLF
jgi:hypothetical protein